MSGFSKEDAKKVIKYVTLFSAGVGAAALFSTAAVAFTGVIGGGYVAAKIAALTGAAIGQFVAHRAFYKAGFEDGFRHPSDFSSGGTMPTFLSRPLGTIAAIGMGLMVGEIGAFPAEYLSQGETSYALQKLGENVNTGTAILGVLMGTASGLAAFHEVEPGLRAGTRARKELLAAPYNP